MENLLKESKEFRMIFKKSQNFLTGNYSSKIKGDGIEFVDLKEYIPGDDVRKIDWKVTARESKPYIKEFLEDKDASHYILLDTSASMKNKLEKAQILASSLLLSSNKQKDSFCIGFFNEKNIQLLPLAKSKVALMKYIYEISNVQIGFEGSLKSILRRILSVATKKSIVSIITDELELDDETVSLLFAIRKKHKLNYFHLFASSEKLIESGLNAFEDSETRTSGIYDLDEDDVEEYKREFENQLNKIKKKLLSIGNNPFLLDIDSNINYQIRKKAQVI